MFAKSFILLLSFFGLMAIAAESDIEGYNIVDLEWDVQATPGGPTIPLKGTVEKVYAQLKAINPNYDIDFPPVNATDAVQARAAAENFNCTDRWLKARLSRIMEGVNYLNRVPGSPRNGPGPGNCGRVSCGYHAAIYWCNDNPSPKQLDSFRKIAEAAAFVAPKCVDNVGFTRGQVFYEDNWNVIVRGTNDKDC